MIVFKIIISPLLQDVLYFQDFVKLLIVKSNNIIVEVTIIQIKIFIAVTVNSYI